MKNAQIKILLLMRGNAGKEVAKLKKALRKILGDAATSYPGLTSGNAFDTDTETALRVWQASVGLVADGIAGPRSLSALGVTPPAKLDIELDNATVSKLFPRTRTASIAKNLPYVTAALAAFVLAVTPMLCVA